MPQINTDSFQRFSLHVPEKHLATGSVQIKFNTAFEWKDDDAENFQELVNSVEGVWNKEGIKDFFIYSKIDDETNERSWEVVPYPESGIKIWKQLTVWWSLTFGGSKTSEKETEALTRKFSDLTRVRLNESLGLNESTCVFCSEATLTRQAVKRGEYVDILYNYAPLPFDDQKLDFLIVPKKHRSRSTNLTAGEVRETAEFTELLIKSFKQKENHVFSSNGPRSGARVAHWQQHVVITKRPESSFFGKFRVLKNILIGTKPLSQEALKHKVEHFRRELNPVV